VGLRFATERAPLVLAAVYLAAALHGLGAADIVGDDEAREAGIVQDVVAGAWLLPRFNGETLPDKPPLFHWLAALPCRAAGFSETAVRLPSALAGAALVGWTARTGAALFGPRAGLVAGALLATMPALFVRTRVARPDVLLALLLAVALGAAFRWWRDGHGRDATAALVVLGLATLAKGPVAPVVFAAAVGGFLAWQRDLGRLPGLATTPGAAAFLVLALGWYAVALAGWGDLFVREHLVGRYLGNLVGGLGGARPHASRSLAAHLLFHPAHLLVVALPWTPLVAVGLWRAWRTGALGDPRLRFLLCWAAAPLVVFTPAAYKLRHYLLPSLPALALLAVPTALALGREPARRPDRATIVALVLLLAGTVLATWVVGFGAVGLSRSDRTTLDAILPLVPGGARGLALAAAVAALAGLAAIAWHAWGALTLLVAAASLLWMLAGAPRVETAVARRDSLKAFAREAARRFPSPAPLVFWGEPIRQVAVHAGRRVPTVRREADLPPGAGLIAAEPVYHALRAARVVGPPLVAASGRVGNLARGLVVLGEAAGPAGHPAH
jgi:4-amino-4-deoxy-L-arabinose transferase-like glycosyltransferase